MNPWRILGIDAEGADARSIKRAYARLIKQHRPDRDPQRFQQIHAAYLQALALVSDEALPDIERQDIQTPRADDAAGVAEAGDCGKDIAEPAGESNGSAGQVDPSRVIDVTTGNVSDPDLDPDLAALGAALDGADAVALESALSRVVIRWRESVQRESAVDMSGVVAAAARAQQTSLEDAITSCLARRGDLARRQVSLDDARLDLDGGAGNLALRWCAANATAGDWVAVSALLRPVVANPAALAARTGRAFLPLADLSAIVFPQAAEALASRGYVDLPASEKWRSTAIDKRILVGRELARLNATVRQTWATVLHRREFDPQDPALQRAVRALWSAPNTQLARQYVREVLPDLVPPAPRRSRRVTERFSSSIPFGMGWIILWLCVKALTQMLGCAGASTNRPTTPTLTSADEQAKEIARQFAAVREANRYQGPLPADYAKFDWLVPIRRSLGKDPEIAASLLRALVAGKGELKRDDLLLPVALDVLLADDTLPEAARLVLPGRIARDWPRLAPVMLARHEAEAGPFGDAIRAAQASLARPAERQ